MDNQNQNDRNPAVPWSSKTAILDSPLNAVGFEIQTLSPHRVAGRILVSPKCCQPFKVLHGGVSAMIAEALASIGAQMASGFQRVAGFHLSINHLQSAEIGDLVLAEATPISLGNPIQVWEVELWKASKTSSLERSRREVVSSSKVTLLCNLPVPKHAQPLVDTLKAFSKL
ncbi:1,4-dihydroxy-2-naphthoyl-CoA thioesterase 1-like [Momordica charantia]|uniref:1,4-dihydroxy-2-naphthoyl-CoA thioesterase 1-like n=1 Tax=Momordica charantia TaxID=3673 RepID=A0A6J1C8Q3_MOMCH|nr:1,4-dihydroxy-2-naphthoyl-CoA thioesterase 1-like [Momordica charantia]